MTPDLFLQQKDAKIRLSLDQAAYDRMLDNGRVVGNPAGTPIIKLTSMPDPRKQFDGLDTPDRSAFEGGSYPTCSECGSTDEWRLMTQVDGTAGTATIAKCMATRTGYGGATRTCGHLAVAYDEDGGPVEYVGNVET